MTAYRYCTTCHTPLLFPQRVVPVCGACFPEWCELGHQEPCQPADQLAK